MSPTDEAAHNYRMTARNWLQAHVPQTTADAGSDEYLTGARKFQAELDAAGFSGITLPKDCGGQGLGEAEQQIFDEEAERFALPTDPFAVGVGMCAPTLADLGSDLQKSRYLPNLLCGNEIWCQLFSEPGAGSDIAGLQTRAVANADGWLINGQKVWTTNAQWADFGALLARTDPDKPKHKGITMFIVDMRAPGLTVRPLKDMTGRSHFNEVYFDDVQVKAKDVVGEVNQGWGAALTMLGHERMAGSGSAWRGSNLLTFAGLVELLDFRNVVKDRGRRDLLAGLYVRERVLDLLNIRMGQESAAGSAPGARGSVSKLATALLLRHAIDVAGEVAGASVIGWDPRDRRGDELALAINSAPSWSIAGGTNEIQRNIIGERLLGLPKEPEVDRTTPFRDLTVGTQH